MISFVLNGSFDKIFNVGTNSWRNLINTEHSPTNSLSFKLFSKVVVGETKTNDLREIELVSIQIANYAGLMFNNCDFFLPLNFLIN